MAVAAAGALIGPFWAVITALVLLTAVAGWIISLTRSPIHALWAFGLPVAVVAIMFVISGWPPRWGHVNHDFATRASDSRSGHGTTRAAGRPPGHRGPSTDGTVTRGPNLGGASMPGSDLRRVDLRNADLRGTDLRRSCLRDVDLRGADLTDANFAGSDVSGARVEDKQIRQARFWPISLPRRSPC